MKKMKKRFLPVFTRSEITKIYFDEITQIRSNLRSVEVYARQKVYCFHCKMDEIVQMLDERFFRCHSNLAVNLANISSIKNGAVYSENGETIAMGREAYRITRRAYTDYLQQAFSRQRAQLIEGQ